MSAEWFVAPGTFNMPMGVFFTPDGTMLVYAVRSQTLYRVSQEGVADVLADNVSGYVGDIDAEGNLFLHMQPNGSVTRIAPDRNSVILVHANEIRTDCDGGFGFGPDGNIYLALNPCSARSKFFQITMAGEITLLADNVPSLQTIRTAPDGRLLAVSSNKIYEISLSDYSFKLIASIPTSVGISPGGFAIAPDGTMFVSTGARRNNGEVFRVTAAGNVQLLAEIPLNGISGIAWNEKTRELVGGQIRQGGLIAVREDGSLRQIVAGNGLVTPMGMAFSPCGDLAVNNDDGGMMTMVSATGEVSWFFDYVSFIPPVSYIVFAPDGTLFTSEAAPGLKPIRVALLRVGSDRLETFIEADMPSGLALRENGALLVSEPSAGRILQVNPDGSRIVVAEGLDYPTALALDENDNLYVVVGTSHMPASPSHPPTAGDTILKIAPDGTRSILAKPGRVAAIVFGPDGMLYMATGGSIARLGAAGRLSPFASGLHEVVGLAFDLAGNLYASDPRKNGIVRIGGFPQGILRVVVTDEYGNPVPEALVRVAAVWPGMSGLLLAADTSGRVAVAAAPRGYTILVTAAGFAPSSVTGTIVESERTTEVVVLLRKK